MSASKFKSCNTCGEVKPLSEFHKKKQNKDGHRSDCKVCACAYSLRWSAANPKRKAATDKQWKQDHREERYACNAKYKSKNPIKSKASTTVNNAVRLGNLVKPTTCSECGIEAKLDGHHCDYSKPLEVMWLCRKCHIAWHKEHGTDLNGEVA